MSEKEEEEEQEEDHDAEGSSNDDEDDYNDDIDDERGNRLIFLCLRSLTNFFRMEDEEVALIRRPKKLINSVEDEDFDRELKKIMQESLEQRKIDPQARQAKLNDVIIPMNILR